MRCSIRCTRHSGAPPVAIIQLWLWLVESCEEGVHLVQRPARALSLRLHIHGVHLRSSRGRARAKGS